MVSKATSKIKAEHSFKNEIVEVWLVFEENPTERNGYKIIYSEDQGFGLMIPGIDENVPIIIGFYGSFLETLFGM